MLFSPLGWVIVCGVNFTGDQRAAGGKNRELDLRHTSLSPHERKSFNSVHCASSKAVHASRRSGCLPLKQFAIAGLIAVFEPPTTQPPKRQQHDRGLLRSLLGNV